MPPFLTNTLLGIVPLTLIGQSWKTHPQNVPKTHPCKSSMSFPFLFSLFQTQIVALSDFWKTHPIVDCRIMGMSLTKTDMAGKLIQKREFSIYEFRVLKQTDFWKAHPNMDGFSRNRSDSFPKKTEISRKFLDEFSKIGL